MRSHPSCTSPGVTSPGSLPISAKKLSTALRFLAISSSRRRVVPLVDALAHTSIAVRNATPRLSATARAVSSMAWASFVILVDGRGKCVPKALPPSERQIVRLLDPGDERAFVARRPRRLVNFFSVRAVAEKPVAAHGYPLPGVFRAVLLNPAQLAG